MLYIYKNKQKLGTHLPFQLNWKWSSNFSISKSIHSLLLFRYQFENGGMFRMDERNWFAVLKRTSFLSCWSSEPRGYAENCNLKFRVFERSEIERLGWNWWFFWNSLLTSINNKMIFTRLYLIKNKKYHLRRSLLNRFDGARNNYDLPVLSSSLRVWNVLWSWGSSWRTHSPRILRRTLNPSRRLWRPHCLEATPWPFSLIRHEN